MKKEYLGDSVYANFDGHGITLTTENGYDPTNEIYMEPEVICALGDFVSRAKKELEATVVVLIKENPQNGVDN